MIKKIVLLPQNNQTSPISFASPKSFEIKDGILIIETVDKYKYTTNLPFMVEEKELDS